MNRILIVHHSVSSAIARDIEQKLSSIGIPFELIDASAGPVVPGLLETAEPLILLLSDNFLKNQSCLSGLFPNLSALQASRKMLWVLTDGTHDDGTPKRTEIDRMSHALHYLSYWQNAWLKLSDERQAAPAAERPMLDGKLDDARQIANQIGDLIGAIRMQPYLTAAQLQADDFAAFFRFFDLEDWHGQYKKRAHKESDTTETPALPESKLDGLLAPEPLEDDLPDWQATSAEAIVQEPEEPEYIPQTTAAPEFLTEDVPMPQNMPMEGGYREEDIAAYVRDARFWLQHGQAQRGLELLQLAREQYPNQPEIEAAYNEITRELGAASLPEIEYLPEAPLQQNPESGAEEANSYYMMGNMAAEKGDFLFAKYCWDRVAELNPAYPGIYRLLGLNTAEHLSDYRETSVHYLQKALEQDPEDAEVLLALANNAHENGKVQDALAYYDNAIALNPGLIRTDLEALRPATGKSEPASSETPPSPVWDPLPVTEPIAPVEEKTGENPASEPVARPGHGLVLITGSTAGIGRATAEAFARAGYRLILTGRRVERLIELKKLLEDAYKADVLILPFDVRDQGAVSAALDNLPENWKPVDILVNNAGLAKGLAPIHEGLLEHWDTMIDTNVKGLLYVTRCIAPDMVARRQGHIINVCSSAGKENYPNGNVYAATKFAVDALTKGMRMDLHKFNIRVSQVSPGHVEETEFALNRFDGDTEKARIYNDFQPLRSSDVAEAILFMATRPPHVNIQDMYMFGTQQASSTIIDRSGR